MFLGMRMPATETSVNSGKRNPVQFNMLGSNNNNYKLWFGQNLPSSSGNLLKSDFPRHIHIYRTLSNYIEY